MSARWAVIGAGYAGIFAAGPLIAAGLDVDVLDARDGPGGLWRDGVYDSVRLITSRHVSAHPEHPMPPGGTFPSGPELLDYLQELARATGVGGRLQRRRVRSVTPDGDGWYVDGARYDGVVLATGLFGAPWIPVLPGELTIPALHTRDYRQVGQLGHDVLVVGLGNSGADVAQDCVDAGRRVTLAVGRGRHVVPRVSLGRPSVELRRPAFIPDLLYRAVLDAGVRAWTGRSPLPQPRHLLMGESDVVHSTLLPLVRSGRVAVRPRVAALRGDRVGFADGGEAAFDTVVWATGYDWALPLRRSLLDGRPAGLPALAGGVWSTVSRGLAVVGLREPRNGRGPYYAALGRLVAAGALAQPRLAEPVGAVLARVVRPDRRSLIDDGVELRRIDRLVAALAQA